jgi:hypothetical protein
MPDAHPTQPDTALYELDTDRYIIAYTLNQQMEMPITRAPQERAWMGNTRMRFAYRCLPLLIANQHGWWIANDHTFSAVWDGREELDAITIRFEGGETHPHSAMTHFGHGVLTFSIPYLFRTPSGYNLLVRGPTNQPRDGIQALDAIVETDWNRATFTMNWIFTRPHTPVTFAKGEPICQIAPVRRGEIEAFRGEVRDIDENSQLKAAYTEWSERRNQFNADLREPDSEAARQLWQKDYFQGMNNGERIEGHQTRLKLHEFENRD